MSDSKEPTSVDKAPADKKSKNNKNLILMIASLVSVVVIVISVVVIVMAVTKGDDKSGQGDETSSSEDKEEEKPVETKTETLAISKLSMKYTYPTWKKDSSAGSGAVAVYKGKDYYMMLAHTAAAQKISSKEFAEASVKSYEEMNFEVKEKLKVQTINGAEWQRVKLYGEKAWTTVLFLADGIDYYIVTFASTATSSDVPEDVEEMIKSLTVKK